MMTNITYYGHSTFLLTIDSKRILFDPFISPNELADQIDIQSIAADYILVTHGHSDHVADVEEIAKNYHSTVVANFEVATWFQEKGIKKTHPMNHGGSKVDRKSTRLNSSHVRTSYPVFCLKKKKNNKN